MGHKCFISYKSEDRYYKNKLVKLFNGKDVIDRSLDSTIDSDDGDYIMQRIRDDYLKDSTVTIFIIGEHSSENEGYDYLMRDKNYFIKRELQASLYNGKYNTRNGILGVVLPDMYSKVYKGEYTCSTCGQRHQYVEVDDTTVIKEFSENYYIKPHYGCAWSENERYCVLVKWSEFIQNPEYYIEKSFKKRSEDISNKVKVRIER